MKATPTLELRFVERSPRPLSQRVSLILQQRWSDGWRDVPVERETYPLPDGATNASFEPIFTPQDRGRLGRRLDRARVKTFG